MTSTNRKQHAKRQLDDRIHKLADSLTHARQSFWRLIQIIRATSTLIVPLPGLGTKAHEPVLRACMRMADQHGQWARSPEAWAGPIANSAVQFRSLVGHLFDQYPVPNFMSRVWLDEQDKPWELEMYLHLAAGKSIRQFESPVPLRLTKSAAAYFMQAPDDLVPMTALRWAHIRSLGGDGQLARELTSRTILAGPTQHEPFWDSVIRFIVRNQPKPLDESVAIVNYLHEQKFQPANAVWRPCDWEAGSGRDPLQPDIDIQGRSLRSLRRHMANWESEVALKHTLPPVKHRKGWNQSGIFPFKCDRRGEVWTVEELLTREDLSVEGGIMRHCVARYAHSCHCNRSSIWSMKVHNGEQRRRVLTIEVIPTTKTICQAKGKLDSPPSCEASEILRLWASQEGLRFRKGF